MIDQVAREEGRRNKKCGNHQVTVKVTFIFFDRDVTREKKNSCDGIQRSIKRWQILNCHGPLSEQPRERDAF